VNSVERLKPTLNRRCQREVDKGPSPVVQIGVPWHRMRIIARRNPVDDAVRLPL